MDESIGKFSAKLIAVNKFGRIRVMQAFYYSQRGEFHFAQGGINLTNDITK